MFQDKDGEYIVDVNRHGHETYRRGETVGPASPSGTDPTW